MYKEMCVHEHGEMCVCCACVLSVLRKGGVCVCAHVCREAWYLNSGNWGMALTSLPPPTLLNKLLYVSIRQQLSSLHLGAAPCGIPFL